MNTKGLIRVGHSNAHGYFLALLLVLSPWMASAYQSGDFGCSLSNGGMLITNYFGSTGDVTIPAVIDGNPVTGIGASAFTNNLVITRLTVPQSVTNIGSSACSSCRNLAKVSLPDGLVGLGNRVFYECISLTNAAIPDSVTILGTNAFYGCSQLAQVKLSAGLKVIPAGTFEQCPKLTGIVIPDGVMFVMERAFSSCVSEFEVTLPSGLVSLGDSAFEDCSRLTQINFPPGLTNIGVSAFEGCIALSTAVIPGGVTTLSASAFEGCESLAQLTLSTGVTTIGSRACAGCARLKGIDLPSSVQSIGLDAFDQCSELTSLHVDSQNANYALVDGVLLDQAQAVLIRCPMDKTGAYVIPATVTKLASSAFLNCSNLSSIVLPALLSQINASAFQGCSSVVSLDFPVGIKAITNAACSGCTSLASVTFQSGLLTIYKEAFYNCSSLTNVPLPTSLNAIGASAFEGCSSLQSITVPTHVTYIGPAVFSNCGSLNAIHVSSGNTAYVEANGMLCFKNTTALLVCPGGMTGAVVLTNSISVIQNWAFAGCSKVTSVSLPPGLLGIGFHAFDGCSALQTISIPASTSVGTGAFSGCSSLPAFTVADGNSYCRSVDGVLYDAAGQALFQYPAGRSGSFSIPDGVVEIQVDAFSGSRQLTSVSIPASVRRIQPGAFPGCDGLTAFTVASANSAYSSVDGVLFDKSGATLVQYPGGRKGSYSIPSSVVGLQPASFSGISGLTSVTVPPLGDAGIGDYAFYQCCDLVEVRFSGNAPVVLGRLEIFGGDSAVAYFDPTTEGWGTGLAGISTAAWMAPQTPSLQIQASGNQLVLTWSAGVLMETTNIVTGTWVETQYSSPCVIHATESQKFYRASVK